jgi:hypothetical protein
MSNKTPNKVKVILSPPSITVYNPPFPQIYPGDWVGAEYWIKEGCNSQRFRAPHFRFDLQGDKDLNLILTNKLMSSYI